MRIQDVMIHLLLKQPFYGYVAAAVTPTESTAVPTIHITMTPAPRLVYNREWYEGLQGEQPVGVVMHELLHLILLHPFRKGNRERNIWTIACDIAVNEHIDRSLLPPDAITLEAISGEIGEKLPGLKSAEFYYDILSRDDNKPKLLEKDGQVRVVLKNGQELKAVHQMEGNASEINKKAVRSMVSELMEQAQAEGEIPGSVSSFISELYQSNEINWKNVLKRFLSGKGKVQTHKTVKRESKRFENLPGSKRTVGIHALLALDESGSISDKQVHKFFAEMLSVRKITGTSLSVVEFDTECSQPVPIERYMREKKRTKNGGTDFRPVFQLADRLRIPLLILFTDGEGPAPESANQKVLWILTRGGKRPAEFGHSVIFEE